MKMIYIVNGPNLNLLGTREPEIYGKDSLADIETMVRAHASGLGAEINFSQSNSEGVIVDKIQEAGQKAGALILNAAAYTHTSVAIHDALKAMTIAKVELHLSNPHARETFRHTSFVSPVVDGVICGFGAPGYVLAVDAAIGMMGA